MDARGRGQVERVRAMIKDENQPGLDLFAKEHPVTWRIILEQLGKEDDVLVKDVVAHLLGKKG